MVTADAFYYDNSSSNSTDISFGNDKEAVDGSPCLKNDEPSEERPVLFFLYPKQKSLSRARYTRHVRLGTSPGQRDR